MVGSSAPPCGGWAGNSQYGLRSIADGLILSTVIPLVAGIRYYINALHKEGGGGDNLAVAWRGPGIAQAIIPGGALAPAGSIIGNEAPSFTGPAVFSIVENSSPGTAVGTVLATDPDPGDSISYQISGGNSGGAFSLEAATGILRVTGGIDYETRPAHHLQILATDSGVPQTSVSLNVTVTIGNIVETNAEALTLNLATGGFPGHGNPALVGFTADPDKDGTPNAIEMLLGTDPATADAPPPVRFDTEEIARKTYLVYEFDVADGIDPALAFDCVGGDMSGIWTPLSNDPVLILQPPGIRTYRVRDDVALEDTPRRFMRI